MLTDGKTPFTWLPKTWYVGFGRRDDEPYGKCGGEKKQQTATVCERRAAPLAHGLDAEVHAEQKYCQAGNEEEPARAEANE